LVLFAEVSLAADHDLAIWVWLDGFPIRHETFALLLDVLDFGPDEILDAELLAVEIQKQLK
jgi:hypothetical protein